MMGPWGQASNWLRKYISAMVRELVRSSFTCLVFVYIKGSKNAACKTKINDLQYIAFIAFSIKNGFLKVCRNWRKLVWGSKCSDITGEFIAQWISRSLYLQHRDHYWKGNFYSASDVWYTTAFVWAWHTAFGRGKNYSGGTILMILKVSCHNPEYCSI